MVQNCPNTQSRQVEIAGENGVILPFGRHRGKPLASVPAGYLRHLLATVPLTRQQRDEIIELVAQHELKKLALDELTPEVKQRLSQLLLRKK